MTPRRRSRRRRRPLPTLFCVLLSLAAAAGVAAAPTSSTVVESRSHHKNPYTQYVPVEGPTRAGAGDRRGGTDSGLRDAMGGLRDALEDTRRILDGEDAHGEEATEEANTDEQGEAGDGNSDGAEGEEPQRRSRPSSDWWERLYQGGPLYDEATGKLIEETVSPGGRGNGHPANRRSHSATVYRTPVVPGGDGGDGGGGQREQEWMIVSGGFTDDDWNSFPVWAYDLTGSRSIGEVEDEIAGDDQAWLTAEERARQGRNVLWVDLTPLPRPGDMTVDGVRVHPGAPSGKENEPQGRVGHLSSVHKDCLYVFGGLTYQMGNFHVDAPGNDDGSDEAIAVWKACGLDKLLNEDVKQSGAGKGLKWERVVSKVDTRPPVPPKPPAAAAGEEEEEKSEENNGNGEEEEEEDEKEGKERNASPGNWRRRNQQRGLLSAAVVHGHHNGTNTARIADTPVHKVPEQHVRSAAFTSPDPSYTLPRGEAQGGHYDEEDSFVFYGGMHHHHASLADTAAAASAGQATTILGDVWKFDYEDETLRLLSPYPPLAWQRDDRNGGYPKARTAHAATVVGHQLILHGGMHFGGLDAYDDDRSSTGEPSSFSSPSNTYATYRTSSRWQALADVWVFDLKTLRWKERVQFPQLARSYHSMVGWGNGTVAAFGGFQQDNNIPGETVAFVFKDLLLSRPNETNWQKLMMPNGVNPPQMSPWRPSSERVARPGITNRLEHTAVVDRHGSMYVWGGRFQTVSQIAGLWRIDLFTQDAKLRYEVAPPDGIEQYEAELQALHMFIATMMFMSLTISSLFSMMRRGGDVEDGGGGGGGGRSLTRRGLSRQVIDSLPLKRYEAAPAPEVTEDGDIVEDVSLSRENSLGDSNEPATLEENLECCPICLTPYEDGVSEIRTLPCSHVYCKECVDAWFSDHTTCPSCRQNIDNAPAPPSEDEDEASRRAAHVSTTGSWRYHSHWRSNGDPSHSAGDVEGEEEVVPSADADAIREQYEFEPRWRFITAFDVSGRMRHRHWSNGQTGEQSTALDGGADVVSDVSSETSRDVEGTRPDNASDENEDRPMVDSIITPRFLGIRRFFSRRGHMAVMAVPGEDDGEDEELEAIELV